MSLSEVYYHPLATQVALYSIVLYHFAICVCYLVICTLINVRFRQILIETQANYRGK